MRPLYWVFIAYLGFLFFIKQLGVLDRVSSRDAARFAGKGLCLLEGEVRGFPEERWGFARWVLKVHRVNGEKARGRVLLEMEHDKSSQPVAAPGDFLRVWAKLEKPKLPTNPGEFDYRAYLSRQGIHKG